jgi:hypothetical protein
MDEIVAHIQKRIGPVHMSYAEIVHGDPPITVHHVKSSLFRRYEVLVTSGMSTRPMTVPAEAAESRFAEVLAILPRGWPLAMSELQDERNYWPIRLLKTLARYPHENDTWLGHGHSLANGGAEADITPYADGTALCAAVLLPPMSLGEAAWSFKRADGELVYFWAVVPLHLNEMKHKIEHGADALMDLFDKHGVTDRIDPLRSPVVT